MKTNVHVIKIKILPNKEALHDQQFRLNKKLLDEQAQERETRLSRLLKKRKKLKKKNTAWKRAIIGISTRQMNSKNFLIFFNHLSRMLFIECCKDTCSAPDPETCLNRPFQRRETKSV